MVRTPLAILRFLAQFVAACESLDMGEAEAVECLPQFLDGSALHSLLIARESSTVSGGEFTWSHAVNFLLRKYVTDDELRTGVEELHSIRQKPFETEEAFLGRIHTAHARLGNYLSQSRLIKVFVTALHNAIRPEVTSFRDNNRRADLKAVVRRACTVGASVRAQATRRIQPSSVAFANAQDVPTHPPGVLGLPTIGGALRNADRHTDPSVASSYTAPAAGHLATNSYDSLTHEVLNMTANGGGGFSTRKVPRIVPSPAPGGRGWERPRSPPPPRKPGSLPPLLRLHRRLYGPTASGSYNTTVRQSAPRAEANRAPHGGFQVTWMGYQRPGKVTTSSFNPFASRNPAPLQAATNGPSPPSTPTARRSVAATLEASEN